MEISGLPGFWGLLRSAQHAILLLDYDGTLAPFHADRMRAEPLEGILPALEKLLEIDNTTTVLVSGRPVAEIQTLTGLDNLIIAGTHGFEIFRPGDGIARTLPADDTLERLNSIEGIAAEIVGPELAERKIATVALHTRKLDPETAAAAQQRFRANVAPLIGAELEVRDFNGGVEVRVPARDKGIALREILAELPAADLIVYIGDDDTDEDAFKALPDNGIGIKVGPPGSPTAAAGRLDSCDDVLRFLTHWIAIRTCQ
jgi:trehalose 6-phosphate phosphatase